MFNKLTQLLLWMTLAGLAQVPCTAAAASPATQAPASTETNRASNEPLRATYEAFGYTGAPQLQPGPLGVKLLTDSTGKPITGRHQARLYRNAPGSAQTLRRRNAWHVVGWGLLMGQVSYMAMASVELSDSATYTYDYNGDYVYDTSTNNAGFYYGLSAAFGGASTLAFLGAHKEEQKLRARVVDGLR